MERIWGFDIGTTSVGFAVVELDEETGAGSILWEGVRIFPESRTPDKLDPLNQNRRAARLIRRQIRRRRLRRKLLREALASAGLLPRFGTPEWQSLMDTGDDAPYHLRARGRRERLEPYEIGRALYHLAHRRGFLSARRAEERAGEKRAREKEEGPVKEEIASLQGKLDAGHLTLGEYLASLTGERKRNRHISREMVVEEFERLWEAQARHHPQLLTGGLKERLRSVLLYQRPIFWRLQTVGECWLERGEPVCPLGSWLGQQFRMLQHVNNVRLCFPGQPPRALEPEERTVVIEKLQQQEAMTFGGVRTALRRLWRERGLDLKPDISLETGGETRLLGNELEAKLAEAFGQAWEKHPSRERLRQELYPRLFAIYNRQIGRKRIELHRLDPFKDEIAPAKARFVEEARREFGITREQAEKLADFEPPRGWLRFSEKAIRKLLPFLEQGRGLNETGGALDQAYPGWREKTEDVFERLPSHPRRMPVLRNPSVNRALNELRKVVNNLLAVYGKPDRIRIELLRELKKTKKERLEISSRYGKNRRSREEAAAALRDNGIQPVTNEAIEKWLLWKESDETCPYTGRTICFDALFRRGGFQVEHIFPLSRSLDNSYLNKTLCATDVNRKKEDRTPFELLGGEAEKWEAVQGRLEKWVKAGTFPLEKMKNFLREDYPAGQEFLEERQKADSSYIAVEARRFLARLGVPVQVANGQVTAQLRKAWGLDSILNPETPWRKNRADHRHHAVDALAVALSSPAFVKRLSDYYARDKRGEKPKLAQPWENFRQDAKARTEAIVVSHRVQRKVSGPLHAQTYYGDTGEEVSKRGITYRYFVTRKPLEKLSDSEIKGEKKAKIRDGAIRKLVQEHVAAHGKNFPPYPVLVNKETGEVREIKRVRLLVKQQKHLMAAVRLAPKTFADLGGNHHMAIFRMPDGRAEYETVPLLEATRRLKAGEPVIRRTSRNGGRFLMSVAANDILEITRKDGSKEYVAIRYCNEKGRVFYKPANMADDPKPEVSFGPARFLEPGIRKVTIDPIGRVRPAND